MEYSVDDLIGMLNLGLIIAKGKEKDMVEIPKDAVPEIIVYLEDFKVCIGP